MKKLKWSKADDNLLVTLFEHYTILGNACIKIVAESIVDPFNQQSEIKRSQSALHARLYKLGLHVFNKSYRKRKSRK